MCQIPPWAISRWDYMGVCGGQIKCHNGYVALYDYEGFHTFLENIEDNENVGIEMWPISESRKVCTQD